MDNPDNQNCPMNPIQNANIFSPYKDSPSKFPPQIKDPKYLFQYSPFQSHINSTPAKNNEFNSCYTPSEKLPSLEIMGFNYPHLQIIIEQILLIERINTKEDK